MSLESNSTLLTELLELANSIPEPTISVSFGDIPDTVCYVDSKGVGKMAAPNTTIDALRGVIFFLGDSSGLELTGDYQVSTSSDSINAVCFKSSGGTFNLLMLGYKVNYNANGGTFDNGKDINTVYYDITNTIEEVTKISKTSNVSDDGLTANTSTGHGNNQSINDIITIPGAESLEVTITYQTEGTSYDWVCVYDGSVTPSSSNYSSSISGKLGGSTKNTSTFTVNGDTVQFYFKSDSSVCGYYGYYAVVKGLSEISTIKITSGNEAIPAREDGLFGGWFLDKECTPGNELKLKDVSEDTEVYAKWLFGMEATLIDFEYMDNGNSTYTITNWKGTLNGVPSTELIIPDNSTIIL